MDNNLISTEKVSTDSRTFYFDLKRARNGRPYLIISEIRKSKGKEAADERQRILFFADEAPAFQKALERMVEQMTLGQEAGNGNSQPENNK